MAEKLDYSATLLTPMQSAEQVKAYLIDMVSQWVLHLSSEDLTLEDEFYHRMSEILQYTMHRSLDYAHRQVSW